MNSRIEKLREHAINVTFTGMRSLEDQLNLLIGWHDSDTMINRIRRSHSKSYMFENAKPIIDDNELIVGKPCFEELTKIKQKQFDKLGKYGRMMTRLGGQNSHMSLDYKKLLNIGIIGIIDEITEYKNNLDLANPNDMEKDSFYTTCVNELNAVCVYAENYSKHALTLANNTDDKTRKQELLVIADNLKCVPKYPAVNFYQALQSIHFIAYCTEGLIQLGRVDRYLYKYYKHDIDNNIITKEKAQELIDCLCILFNEYIPKGLAIGFMVGGRDSVGNDVTNELTYMFIESIRHTMMIYPGIGLCVNENTPADLLKLSIECLAEGHSHPALFNDNVITNGLLSYGLSNEEACDYIHSTCVEITPCACSGAWVASPYHNISQYLLDLMMSDQSNNIKTYDDLLINMKNIISENIKMQVIDQNKLQMERYHHGGDALVSCFINDCLKKGVDVDSGGAKYNFIMPSFVGLSNLADSLISIKHLVFEDKKLSITKFYKILIDDYQDNELLLSYIQNKIPKYGNDVDECDELVSIISKWLTSECSKYQTYLGDKFIPSLFCWIQHEQLGRETIATPDGRTKGFPFGDGSGPAQGREKNGPTCSILSSTSWEHTPFIGGIAINMKFVKSLLDENSNEKIAALIKTFMQRGGFEIQINSVDKDTLINAQDNPDEYKDLVVRVGGYSDYFVHLSNEMQQEVIKRHEHTI